MVQPGVCGFKGMPSAFGFDVSNIDNRHPLSSQNIDLLIVEMCPTFGLTGRSHLTARPETVYWSQLNVSSCNSVDVGSSSLRIVNTPEAVVNIQAYL